MTEAAQREGLAELLGGPRGIVDAGLPGVLFGVAYAAFGQQLGPALWVALGSAAVLFVISLVQRRSVQQSIAGLVGVGIMALVARWTGQAEAFYLPSILKNAGYAAAYAISVLVRWPLLGVFLGPVLGEGFHWRQDPARRRAYARASWVWCGMFLVRLLVQIPLYLAGAVAALGIAGIFLRHPAVRAHRLHHLGDPARRAHDQARTGPAGRDRRRRVGGDRRRRLGLRRGRARGSAVAAARRPGSRRTAARRRPRAGRRGSGR